MCDKSWGAGAETKSIVKKKREKAEDFIGWVSSDGNLKVVGMFEKERGNRKYKVICKICSQDPELFPDGYFVSTRQSLERGGKPCGCSIKPEWTKDQCLIRVRRSAEKQGFVARNFIEDFSVRRIFTKVECLCPIHNHIWFPTADNVIRNVSGCAKCSGVYKPTYQEAIDKCENICLNNNYKFISFPEGYKGKDSKLEYKCPIHGIQNVSYHNFVYHGSRCSGCATHGYNPSKQGSFYVVKWAKCDHSFIKFGITNRKILSRIKNQAGKTNYNYEILFQQTWADGSVPLNIERTIKQSNMFNVGVIDINNFEDGFTETLDTGCLENLLIFVENILQTQPV